MVDGDREMERQRNVEMESWREGMNTEIPVDRSTMGEEEGT